MFKMNIIINYFYRFRPLSQVEKNARLTAQA